MEIKRLPEVDNKLDVRTSKTSTSKFYFYIGFWGYIIFIIAACYGLYAHRYDDSGKHVKVQSSTLYNPKYK